MALYLRYLPTHAGDDTAVMGDGTRAVFVMTTGKFAVGFMASAGTPLIPNGAIILERHLVSLIMSEYGQLGSSLLFFPNREFTANTGRGKKSQLEVK